MLCVRWWTCEIDKYIDLRACAILGMGKQIHRLVYLPAFWPLSFVVHFFSKMAYFLIHKDPSTQLLYMMYI